MGFRISWLGVRTLHRPGLLAAAGLQATTEVVEANEAPFSCTDLPTDWTILFSNDFEYAAPDHLDALAGDYPMLSCQVHEGIMYFAARCHTGGREIWSVSHDAQNGVYDLLVTGTPPAELARIHSAKVMEQDKAGGRSARVDYVSSIPVDLAAALTGYRYDMGAPVFMKAIRRR